MQHRRTQLAGQLDVNGPGAPGAVERLYRQHLRCRIHHDNLTTTLLKNAMYDPVLVQQCTQGQKVLLHSHAEGLVGKWHQFTSALLQRSLSLQLA